MIVVHISFFPFQKFSRNGGRLDVDGREIVNDIASKIETLLSNRVEAVKVSVYGHVTTCIHACPGCVLFLYG